MERIILTQLENLEILSEQNRLLKEQNDVLQKTSQKLKHQFLEKDKPKAYDT